MAITLPVTETELRAYVYEAVKEHGISSIDLVTDETTWIDLGYDSLDEIEMIMHVEADLVVEIKDEDAMRLKKVRHLIEYLAKRLNISLEQKATIQDQEQVPNNKKTLH